MFLFDAKQSRVFCYCYCLLCWKMFVLVIFVSCNNFRFDRNFLAHFVTLAARKVSGVTLSNGSRRNVDGGQLLLFCARSVRRPLRSPFPSRRAHWAAPLVGRGPESGFRETWVELGGVAEDAAVWRGERFRREGSFFSGTADWEGRNGNLMGDAVKS